MSALAPAPSTLGLASPALGPWFAADVKLPVANADLSVTLTLNSGDDWLPPTGGLLSFVVAASTRPRDLATLRQANGDSAFTDNALVALFRLLPEVEVRLSGMLARIPSPLTPAAAASAMPTRQTVRTIALELPENPPTVAALLPRISPQASGTTDADKAANVGLKLKSNGTDLDNGDNGPMRDLKQPGVFQNARDKLLHLGSTVSNAKLWAFDDRGRAIDPGAVAGWWSFLATTVFNNLWAPGINGAEKRTATVDPQLSVHLVNAHEGKMRPYEENRLNLSNAVGTGAVRTRSTSATAALTVGFTPAPAATGPPDDLPTPEVALLPNGPYATSVALWTSGPVNAALARDFVRVAVVSVEEQLVGQRRVPPSTTTAAQRRADDQNRVSTRVVIGRSPAPAFLLSTDAAATALTGLFTGGVTRLTTSVLDGDWTGLPAPTPGLPATSPPAALPIATLTVTALTGGGTATAGTIAGQRALFEMNLGATLAGAWVRVWPLGFDPAEGRHIRLDGGAGKVDSTGAVTLVMALPDGVVVTDALMGADVVIVTAARARLYSDVRFARPTPVGGTELLITGVTATIVQCETGQTFPGGTIPPGSIVSGSTLVARTTPPSVIDRGSLPASALSATAINTVIGAADFVALTQPAFRAEAEGTAMASLPAKGATVTRLARNLLARIAAPGAPLPTMERLEVAAANVSATAVTAVLATTPPLSRYHETGPSQDGNPGSPAAVEIHGTGASLSGPGAIGIAEYVRDRTIRLTPDLVGAAATALPTPTAPTTPSLWAASLRTVGADVEGEPGLGALIANVNPAVSAYPFGGPWASIQAWLAGQNITVPAAIAGPVDSVIRAVDRRMQAAGWGAREGAVSLDAAIHRAEDFVYIETPALDGLKAGSFGNAADDPLDLLTTLSDRMQARRGLVVIICAPVRMLPGMPQPLAGVRDQALFDAIGRLDHQRVVLFSPSSGPGRSLRIASTTVIVDDAYVLTGTTHLWRRGLTFDASLAVSVFDETLTAGRPAGIVTFRRALIAGRLDLRPALLPDDPVELLAALRALGRMTRDEKALRDEPGSFRLATTAIKPPKNVPSSQDLNIWDPDGTRPAPGLDVLAWLTSLAAAAQQAVSDFTTPAPP